MVNCTFNAQARQAVSVLLCVGAWKLLPIGGIKIVNRLKSALAFSFLPRTFTVEHLMLSYPEWF